MTVFDVLILIKSVELSDFSFVFVLHFKGKPNLTSLSENPAKTRKLSLKFHTIQMSCLESTILLKNFSCDFSLPVTTYEM